MASLKSLMQAKKASNTSQRITAPFADYSRRTNALSCSLCQLPVKHESLWGAHTQSKGHRVAVQRFEAEQQQAAAAQAKKRKLDSPDDAPSKRARDDDDDDDPPQEHEGALPAGFFANPSEAPAPRAPSPANAPVAAATGGSGATTAAAAAAAPADDPDWAAFEAFLADDSAPAPLPGSSSSAPPAPATGRKTASATIRAQPVRFEFGAPVVAAEGEEVPGAGEEDGEEEEEEQETEEEKAEREAREEREEMMARLEEEEREQKEADEKVTVLKRRLEAIRAARQKKAAPAS